MTDRTTDPAVSAPKEQTLSHPDASPDKPAENRAARFAGMRLCGARTRAGTPCRAPAVRGRARCRMHGGAAGSGAPAGNRNALKHGYHTAAAKARRRNMNAFIRALNVSLAAIERGYDEMR